MKIRTIASGSTGNCYHVSNGESSILIECGIPIKKIRQGCGFSLSSVSGCLLSHFHEDHCKSVKDIVKSGIDVFCSTETVDVTGISGHRVHAIKHGDQFSIGPWKCTAFDVEHDVPGALGFLISSGGERLLFATDTFFIRHRFKGLTHLMVECNYSEKVLTDNVEFGIIEPYIANRLLKSHMSVENLLNFLEATDLSAVKEIHLIHISKGNGDPDSFKTIVQSVTGKMVFAHG